MPNIKAAIKWARRSEKRAERNRGAKTRLKTLFKKGSAGGDATTVSSVESEFDKAAQKGIIHPNKAARKKARLARAAHKNLPQPAPKKAKAAAPPPEPEAPVKPARKRGLFGRVKKTEET